ncbi:NAD(P)H-dependent glycerol-3-phosphate dehydrogenase [Celeribacter sp.]|uniref:NAD(P)H-dependent glycerol-3-phosphate dehydrogenase n=1 Tax=Celeribacter sp. TaxID=1890673 RepID=UPI003A8E946D
MRDLIIIGAGAFGTALAVAYAQDGKHVTLIGRDAEAMAAIEATRRTPRLPDVSLPDGLIATASLESLYKYPSSPILVATPTQALSNTLKQIDAPTSGRAIVACCKGIDLKSHVGPSRVIEQVCPDAIPAVLTGPSFAADIARGLPTASTLACADEVVGQELQRALSTAKLRLYLSSDVIGAELGGALKNVIAIACGACIGSGLGESARAALMTRGFAEMQRLVIHFGARPETLTGLSGFGDLALTCTSDQSRNYQLGFTLGRGEAFDPTITVEGKSTARAVRELADTLGIDLPITKAVDAISSGEMSVPDALSALLSRPLKKE